VGGLTQGWTVAKALLGFERRFTGSPKHAQYTFGQVQKLARQRGLFDDPAFVARWATPPLDTLDLRAADTGFAERAKRGEAIPPSISMLTIWSTETFEQLAWLLVESAADCAALREHVRSDGIDVHGWPRCSTPSAPSSSPAATRSGATSWHARCWTCRQPEIIGPAHRLLPRPLGLQGGTDRR
jgi:hypothetical protein